MAAGLIVTGCTTLVDDPGAYRASKNTTIGFPGVMVNPTKATGLGLTLQMPKSGTLRINSGETGDQAQSINPGAVSLESERRIAQETYGLDAFALAFPSPKSFFFVGVGANVVRARSAYDEHTETFGLNQAKTNVEWVDQTLAVTLPIGIAVNTKEGATSMIAAGPKYVVANDRSFVFDGETSGVDRMKRADTLAAYDSVTQKLGLQILYLAGYSF